MPMMCVQPPSARGRTQCDDHQETPHERPVDVFPSKSAGKRPAPAASRSRPTPSDDLHKRELERFFYSDHWCYVGLEAEMPEAGRLQAHGGRRALGDPGARRRRQRSTWSRTSARTAACSFCRERHGNRKDFTCPYHQWNYTLKGDLQGVPFRRGVKQDGQVTAACRPTSRPAEHGLTKLKVATRGGVVFASFDHERRIVRGLPRPDDPAATSTACSTAAS